MFNAIWEVIFMNIREGLIPTVLGTAVTATGYALKQKRGTNKMIANTVFGFGLAHLVLGTIDLFEHRNEDY
ncbi:MAG: asparagine synthase [Bacillales bacterium]|jgi:formate/nitrite transporter FocA (FNT family)|nr:asparagine synthase [Bacillales bacterium]